MLWFVVYTVISSVLETAKPHGSCSSRQESTQGQYMLTRNTSHDSNLHSTLRARVLHSFLYTVCLVRYRAGALNLQAGVKQCAFLPKTAKSTEIMSGHVGLSHFQTTHNALGSFGVIQWTFENFHL